MKKKKTGKRLSFGLLSVSGIILAGTLALAASCFAETVPLTSTEAFKWYKFGEMDISISSKGADFEAGDVLPLNFEIANQNEFPITEGSLYIKIYREKKKDPKKDYFKQVATKEELNQEVSLTDQFFAAEDLSIDAKGRIRLAYNYQIPKSAPEGKYKAVAYFQSIKKINLQGLSFTDDVPGSFFYYQVKNPSQKGAVEFDRGKAAVNGELYDFNSMLRVYGADENVKISSVLSNSTNSAQKVIVSKTYSSWDGLLEKNVFGNDKSEENLAPGENKNIEFTVPKTASPVTYATIKAEWGGGARSIMNIRFAKNVPADARINSFGVLKFPLKAREPVAFFLTAHEVKPYENVFESILKENGEIDEAKKADFEKRQPTYGIEAVLKDDNQEVLQTFSWKGKLSGEVSGFEATFNPSKDHNYLRLETTLTNLSTNKVADTSVMTYYCQKSNFSGCSADANFSKEGSIGDQNKEKISKENQVLGKKPGWLAIWIVIIIFILGLSGAVAYRLYNKRNY